MISKATISSLYRDQLPIIFRFHFTFHFFEIILIFLHQKCLPQKSMDSPLCFGQKISPERCRCDSSSRFNRILVVADVVGQTSLAGCSLLRWVFFVSCSSSYSSSSSVFSIVCLSRLVLCPTGRATSSQRPFYVNVDTVFLRPDEDIEIRVEFDPAFKVDRVCGTVKQKLSIVYQDGDLVKGALMDMFTLRTVLEDPL